MHHYFGVYLNNYNVQHGLDRFGFFSTDHAMTDVFFKTDKYFEIIIVIFITKTLKPNILI